MKQQTEQLNENQVSKAKTNTIQLLRETYQITPPNQAIFDAVKSNWDGVAKPLDGLGSFEQMTAQIGAIQGNTEVSALPRAVVVMCADNGIVAEGVSQSGKEVTFAVAQSMGRRESSVCRMAKASNTDVIPVDIGIDSPQKAENVIDKRVANGTKNFAKEPAMIEEETLAAIEVGVNLVKQCKENGYRILATGEMGIGNTTTSSAVAAAILRRLACETAGRGAGLDSAGFSKKQQVIQSAIDRYGLYEADAFTILQTVGGLDIAGLTGVFIGGAVYHVPIVLDGLISGVAALLAKKLVPGSEQVMIASHLGKEPAAKAILSELGLQPVIHANLALGEGTGAVMLFPLLDLALSVYDGHTGFSSLEMEPYQRFS